MQKRLRVYRTFFLGLLIGLVYAVIVSDQSATVVPPWLDIFEQRVLVLTFSGIFGGIVYTIMVDGNVELPRFRDRHGNHFEAGLLGDMLLGLAGAFILEFLTTPIGISSDLQAQLQAETSYIAVAAKGLIGGYGSKTLMDMALNSLLKEVKEKDQQRQTVEAENWELVDEVESLESERRNALSEQALMQQLNVHVETGLPPAEVEALISEIQRSGPAVQQRLFQITKHLRRTTSRTAEFRASTRRTIPIFAALVEADPKQFGYHAQLAFAYKDADDPPTRAHLTQALSHLNQAIALRPSSEQAHTWKYELNRAMIRIEQELLDQDTESIKTLSITDEHKERIVADLLTVAEQYGLDRVMEYAIAYHLPNSIVQWVQKHYLWLQQHDQASLIVVQLSDMLGWSPDNLDASDTQPVPPQPAQPNDAVPDDAPDDVPDAVPDDVPGNVQDDVNVEDTDAPKRPDPASSDLPESSDLDDTRHHLDVLKEASRQEWQPSIDSQNEPLHFRSALERWHRALDKARPIGAVGTASRAAMTVTGVLASYQLARHDQERVAQCLVRFQWAGAKSGVPPAILAAIASRESQCGQVLKPDGMHPTDPFFGIMQLDQRNVTPVASMGTQPDPASQEHIDEAADLLSMALHDIAQRYPDWPDEYVLQGAIAAYNVGVEQVHMATTAEIDRGTTGQDYSSDVMARAQFFAETFPDLATTMLEMEVPYSGLPLATARSPVTS